MVLSPDCSFHQRVDGGPGLLKVRRRLDVSRERVRQVELKALRKLRNPTRLAPTTL